MKKIISIFLLLATVATVSAQRFEWAKGFESCYDYGAIINSSVTDSLGNLNIMGSFKYDAEWMTGNGGIPLLPEITSHYGIYDLSVLIAKISPEGEILWKKIVANDNNGVCLPYDIRLIGDTAIACMFDFEVPTYDSRCYYLDTLLIVDTCPMIPPLVHLNYPCNQQNFYWHYTLAFVTLDFDGKVLEDHFIRLTAVDNEGNDIVAYDGTLNNIFIDNPSFNIDKDGNIYLYRQTTDYIDDSTSAEKGAFSAIKIWDDTVLVGSFPVEGNPQSWWQQVLKFSPHFDTLLASRYVIQKSNYTKYHSNYYWNSIIDTASNLYTIVTLQGSNQEECYVIDSMQNMMVFQNSKSGLKGFMVKFDSGLNAKLVVDLSDSIINYTTNNKSLVAFHSIAIDKDSGYVFLSVTTDRSFVGDTSNLCSVLVYNGEPLNVKNTSFVMAFHNTDTQPSLYSYCQIPSRINASFEPGAYFVRANMACNNNRIFTQASYRGGLKYNNVEQLTNSIYDINLGFFVFDYAGHVISHYSYDIDNRGTDRGGPVDIRDSILYLMPNIWTHATFGETTIYSCKSYACIAKYVDTSFMTPYVYTGEPEDLKIQMTEGEGAWLVYPNPFRQRVKVRHEGSSPIVKAFITDRQGRQTTLTVQQVDNRNYIVDFTSLPQDNYFLTLVTAAGNQRTVQIRKQSEVFGE